MNVIDHLLVNGDSPRPLRHSKKLSSFLGHEVQVAGVNVAASVEGRHVLLEKSRKLARSVGTQDHNALIVNEKGGCHLITSPANKESATSRLERFSLGSQFADV